MRMPRLVTLVALVLFGTLVLLFCSAPLAAQSPVEDCSDDTELRADIAASLVITFTCPPSTITLTAPITIERYVEIDGGNVITLSGGGVTHLFDVERAAGTLRLRNLALVDGAGPTVTVPITAPAAGSIVNRGVLILDGVALAQNRSLSQGGAGAIWSDGYLEIRGSEIISNTGGGSGALTLQETALIVDSTFDDNQGGQSGAIYTLGNLTLQQVALRQNIGSAGAGAIFASGPPSAPPSIEIVESTLDGNDGASCGAIQAQNIGILFEASTVSRNRSSGGGALCVDSQNHGWLGVYNSTISGNQSHGAAIVLGGDSYAFARSSTIVFNLPSVDAVGGSVGGIETRSKNWVVGQNMILYGNGDIQCDVEPGENTGFFYSVLGDHSCPEFITSLFAPNNRYGDPQLGTLTDNGGITETHMPGTSSIALEIGSARYAFLPCESPDQRGAARWYGLCDAGSVEVVQGELFFVPVIASSNFFGD